MVMTATDRRLRRKRLTDDGAIELLKGLAMADRPRKVVPFAERIHLARLKDEGFQRLYVELLQENVVRRNELQSALERADELLTQDDHHGFAAALAALNALTSYAELADSAAIDYLRTTLKDRKPGIRNTLNAEFEGRLAGLIEVMSWALKGEGGARAAYQASSGIPRKIVKLAENYAKRAGIPWGVRKKSSRGDTTGGSKVRSVYQRVKVDPKLSEAQSFLYADLGDLPVQRLEFLDIVRSGRWAQRNGGDLRKWTLERAQFYFSTERLPPSSD
jgi:hypothetical protein